MSTIFGRDELEMQMQDESVDQGTNNSSTTTEVDIEFTPIPPRSSRGRTAALVIGGLALVSALVAGVFVAAGDDPTEVAVAADETGDDGAAEIDDGVRPDEGADPDAEDADVEDAAEDGQDEAIADEAMTDAEMSDSMMVEQAMDSAYGVDVGQLQWIDGRGFVGIGHGMNGMVLHESADGTSWTQTPLEGIDANSSMWQIVEDDGTWYGLLEEWPNEELLFEESAEPTAEMFFGPYPQPERFVASSTDLVNWTVTPIPNLAEGDEEFYVSSLAVSNGRVVMSGEVMAHGPDEMKILYDAGLLDVEDFESFCGIDVAGEDDPILVYRCDYEIDEQMAMLEERMATADTDEAQAEIEAEMDALMAEYDENYEPEVLIEIAVGDPLHDELFSLWSGHGHEPETIVLSGPPAGPFVATPVDATHLYSIVATDAGFAGLAHNESGVVVHTSTDGTSWTRSTEIDGWIDQLITFDGALVATGRTSASNELLLFRSADGGTTWTQTPLESSLYDGHGWALTGPAGVAVMVEGSLEPYDHQMDDFMPEPLSIVKDGYTLTIEFAEGSTMTLSGPDGAVIHSFDEEEMWSSRNPGIEGVVEVSGRWDSDLTFLDPESGEPLVTFGESDFEAAWEENEANMSVEEGEWEEPEWGAQLLFSADGVTFVEIEGEFGSDETSSTQLMGVGDDEILVAKHTWSEQEPPQELFGFEMEGRDPTDAEIEALDAWFAEHNGVEWIRIPVG